jgi:hypothetical protein
MTAKPKCGGKLLKRAGNCTRPAGWGTTHPGFGRCKLHGGSAPSGRSAGARKQAEAELARLSLPPVDDPLSALAAVTAEVLAWKDQMAGLVNKLTSVRYEGDGMGEQLRAEVALFERALDRCEKFLTAMARLDIDDRLARITEARAAVFVAVLLAALGAVPHPDRDLFLAAVDAEFGRQGG